MSDSEAIDPGLLARAGWTAEELYWEELSEAALGLPAPEARPYWREAAQVALDCFAALDARRATSLANLALAEALDGRLPEAAALLAEAQAAWQAAGPWVEALKPERRARSSLFHLRLQRKHPGAYDHWSRERYAVLFAEGAAALAARAEGRYRPAAPAARWQAERPAGFEESRRLIAAVLLIAPDP